MSPEKRYEIWASLHPRLRSKMMTKKHERTVVVVGFSIKGEDTVVDRSYSSVRISVTRAEGGYEFEVLKSTVSAAAGCSTTVSRQRGAEGRR